MQLSSVGDLHQLEQLSKQENMDFNEGSTAQGTVMKDDFASPLSDHQSILVSLSSRCLRKGSVCERPHLKRIKYYGSSDKPLGKFLKDSLFNVVRLLTFTLSVLSSSGMLLFYGAGSKCFKDFCYLSKSNTIVLLQKRTR